MTVRVADVAIHVIHDLGDFLPATAGSGAQVVISGHSHQPAIARRDGILFVNPGSAGPRRFKLPVSVAELIVTETASVDARIHALDVTAARGKRPR